MSLPGFDLPSLLAKLQAGDWSVMEQLEEKFGASPEAREARALAAEEERALLLAMGKIPDEVLEWLYDQTWGRMTFSVMSRPDPQQALLYGAFREGQNALALTILRAVAKARQVDQPPVEGESDVQVRPTRRQRASGRGKRKR